MRPVTFGALILCSLPLLCASSVWPTSAFADDDLIDGALWRFHMTPLKRGPTPLHGTFRVKGKQLFQKSRPGSKEYDQLMAEKTDFKKKTTYLRVDDMRAFEKETRKPHLGLKGKLVLQFDELGEWSGRFIDSDGAHWEFKCKRFQE